jgi:hypothetical protein
MLEALCHLSYTLRLSHKRFLKYSLSQLLVAPSFNPSYLENLDWVDHGPRPALAKIFARPHFNRKELGIVAHACHPSYGRKHKIRELQSRPAWTKSKTLVPK